MAATRAPQAAWFAEGGSDDEEDELGEARVDSVWLAPSCSQLHEHSMTNYINILVLIQHSNLVPF